MFHSSTKQQGMTFGGLIFTLAFIAILVLFAVRAFPLYNEKMEVISAMNTVASRPDAASMSPAQVRRMFLRNINATTNINRFTEQNLKDYVDVIQPQKEGEPKVMRVHYTIKNHLFQDLSLLMTVDVRKPMRGNAGANNE